MGVPHAGGSTSQPLVINGYQLFVWSGFLDRWQALRREVERLKALHPDTYRSMPATKLFAAVRSATLRHIPNNPASPSFRQGNALGRDFRHWRRATFFQRFRLFFRFSEEMSVIVYVWLNDEPTLRKRGARTDPYTVFRTMLERGTPPTDWQALVHACQILDEGDTRER